MRWFACWQYGSCAMHLFAERGDAHACKNTMAKTIYSWRRKLLGCVESGANCEWLRCVECERVYFPFLVLWLLPFCAVIIIIIDVTSLLRSYFYCHLCFVFAGDNVRSVFIYSEEIAASQLRKRAMVANGGRRRGAKELFNSTMSPLYQLRSSETE